MANQASMSSPQLQAAAGPSAPSATGGGVVGSLSNFGNDVANLIELQAKLASFDMAECRSRIIWPAVGLVSGGLFALGAIPVALLGVAELLSKAAGLSQGASMLIVALLVLAAAGLAAYLSLRGVTESTKSFRRSREEFTRNISWLRTVVVHSGRS